MSLWENYALLVLGHCCYYRPSTSLLRVAHIAVYLLFGHCSFFRGIPSAAQMCCSWTWLLTGCTQVHSSQQYLRRGSTRTQDIDGIPGIDRRLQRQRPIKAQDILHGFRGWHLSSERLRGVATGSACITYIETCLIVRMVISYLESLHAETRNLEHRRCGPKKKTWETPRLIQGSYRGDP